MIFPRFTRLRTLLFDEGGATVLEYGLICSLIFLVIIGAVTLFATNTVNMWNLIATHVTHS
jgi:pilus assembly protein Flp/PilA